MSDIDTKAPISPKLIRHIARKMYNLTAEQWKALNEEDRKTRIEQSRKVLRSERNFLDRVAKGETKDDDDD